MSKKDTSLCIMSLVSNSLDIHYFISIRVFFIVILLLQKIYLNVMNSTFFTNLSMFCILPFIRDSTVSQLVYFAHNLFILSLLEFCIYPRGYST